MVRAEQYEHIYDIKLNKTDAFWLVAIRLPGETTHKTAITTFAAVRTANFTNHLSLYSHSSRELNFFCPPLSTITFNYYFPLLSIPESINMLSLKNVTSLVYIG